jgi:hypothetical protein
VILQRRWLPLLPVAVFGVLTLASPTHDGPTLCPFALITGTACPGCGMTRAFAWLLRGDLSQALTYHPLAPLIALELLLVVGWWLARRLGRAPDPGRLPALVMAVTGVLLLLTWIVRWASGTLPPV